MVKFRMDVNMLDVMMIYEIFGFCSLGLNWLGTDYWEPHKNLTCQNLWSLVGLPGYQPAGKSVICLTSVRASTFLITGAVRCRLINLLASYYFLRCVGPALFIWRPDTLRLFYVCADNSGHLHHVDRLAHLQVCKVGDLAWFAFWFCVFEDREQTIISHNELACVLRLSIFSLCLKFIRFNIVP